MVKEQLGLEGLLLIESQMKEVKEVKEVTMKIWN